MGASLLTLDLGNTRLKLCLWAEDEPSLLAQPSARAAFATDGPWLGRMGHWLDEYDPPARSALASVAACELEQPLASALGLRYGRDALCRPEAGLVIECREPDAVGCDRLFAARGALEHAPHGAIVVDLGTALTVDAVRPLNTGRTGDRGVFLGGSIGVGPALAAEALASGTARLPQVVPEPLPPALGRTSEEAIAAGVALGVLGAARELVLRVAREAGLGDAPVVVTGGARAFLGAPQAFGSRPRIDDPDLVHRGLRAAARRA